MNVKAEYIRQIELVKWINDHLACPFDLSSRNLQLAHPCFDLAIEHHAAICSLCESQLYGPMFALLRVEFEALAKGLWLYHVASTEDFARYEKEDSGIGFGTTLNLIEKKLEVSETVLSVIKKRQWSIFCSFTHTGYQALVRRCNETHTGPVNYRTQEIVSALRHSGLFAVLAAVELSAMTGDNVIIESTLAMARNYGK